MKTAAGVAIGIVIFVVALAAIFAVYNIHPSIQSNSNPVQVSNYSAETNSSNSQINAIQSNITSLNALKPQLSSINNSINSLGTDIKGKLSELENKVNQQVTNPTATPAPIVVSLDKSSYFAGDTIHVTASGVADPQEAVQVQLVAHSGFVVMYRDTLSDSTGKVLFDFPLSSTLTPGDFQIKLVSGQQTGYSQPITIMASPSYGGGSGVTLSGVPSSSSPSSPPPTTTSLNQFTAQTDKGVYQVGDTIKVYGIGVPNSSIAGVFTSPSGKTFTSNTTVQPDGSYMFFVNSQSFEAGNWYITVHNQGIERITHFDISASSYSSSYLFTAKASSSTYQIGDIIRVSGTAQPFTVVTAVLTSPSGLTYDTSTTASSGGYVVSFSTAQGYETGNWSITLTNQGQIIQVSITIGSSPLSTSSSSGSTPFTAQTDKTIYKKGDMIRISGTGVASTTVKAALTSPSGITYNGAAMTNPDGSYGINYSTLPSFETGNWYITLNNNGLTRVISIFME